MCKNFEFGNPGKVGNQKLIKGCTISDGYDIENVILDCAQLKDP